MGCTSSTANMPEPQTSTTDNIDNNVASENSGEHNIRSEFEQKQKISEDQINIKETKIIENDKVNSAYSNMDTNDIQDIATAEIHNDTIQISESSPLEENYVSLKDVVDKVISENVEDEEDLNLTQIQDMELDRQIEEIITDSNASDDVEVIEYNKDEAKETTSPTQSEDSRATRWEALADIAAELPPSLAVDPLTGLIYTLTK